MSMYVARIESRFNGGMGWETRGFIHTERKFVGNRKQAELCVCFLGNARCEFAWASFVLLNRHDVP